MTTPKPTPDLDALEAMRSALDALTVGSGEWIEAWERYADTSAYAAPALIAAARENATLRAELDQMIGISSDLRFALDAMTKERDEARQWRCFHCDEVFTTKETAAAHFGYSECSDPACRVDGGLAAAYRELEARWSNCLSECCEHTKAYHAKEDDKRRALVAEERRGYDKGVADMRAELAAAEARGVAKGLEMAREIAETVRATAQDGVTRTSSATATTRTFQESLANYLEAGAVCGARDIIAFIDARLSAMERGE